MRVMSTLAFKGMLDELTPVFSARTGITVSLVFDPTVLVIKRIHAGERGDVALLTARGVEDLIAAGTLAAGSMVDIAKSEVGIAVKAGAPKPDLATAESARAALLTCKSIAYSKSGASGIFFAALIERLGIADAVNAKATVIESGFTAALAADGRVELAVQQVSELMTIPGIDIAGALPEPLQERLTFSGGVFAAAEHGDAARAFLRFLASAEFAPSYRAKGLLPCVG